MPAEATLAVLGRAAEAVAKAVGKEKDWTLRGTREGQYRIDLVADEAALDVLVGAGFDVLSEESGRTGTSSSLLAVLDPIDGSTNAARGIPWYATSICVVDAEGPLCALVVNQAQKTRYEAIRGRGAKRDGRPIHPSRTTALADAVIGVSGMAGVRVGWRQFRSFGAAALDLCSVADARLDGFVEWAPDALGVWDYLGGMLVCGEAGGFVAEANGEPLVTRQHDARRSPIAAGTSPLLEALVAARTGRTHR